MLVRIGLLLIFVLAIWGLIFGYRIYNTKRIFRSTVSDMDKTFKTEIPIGTDLTVAINKLNGIRCEDTSYIKRTYTVTKKNEVVYATLVVASNMTENTCSFVFAFDNAMKLNTYSYKSYYLGL